MAEQTVTERNVVPKEGTAVKSQIVGGLSVLLGVVTFYLGLNINPIVGEYTLNPLGFNTELLSVLSGVSIALLAVGYFLVRRNPLGWWSGFILSAVTVVGSVLALVVTMNPLYAAGAVVGLLVAGALLHEERAYGVSVL